MYRKEVKPIKILKYKAEKMKKSRDRIPDEVLKGIFPKKTEQISIRR